MSQSDIERAAARRAAAPAAERTARRNLLVESLGDTRWGGAAVLAIVVACIGVPGVLFVKLGPSNFYIQLGVALVFAVAALAVAIALPAYVQDRLASRRLAALGALGGDFDVGRYSAQLSQPRAQGRLVVNVRFAAPLAPAPRAQLEQHLGAWHLEWDGATLLAETPPLPGTLVLDERFKSPGSPRAAFTNAAFHAHLRSLLAALPARPAALAVDIDGAVLPWDADA